MKIETALRAGRTVVKTSFCEAPFKLANVTEDKRQKELRLMLMCSSPGVLDEDEYDFSICVGEGSSLYWQTQSYQRLFQMKQGAVQNTTVHLQKGASLVYLPHPSVPHRASVFTAHNKIYLAKDCTLVWGELISCGRKMNDEVFQFSSYHSLTEIFLNGRLAVKENLLLKPGEMNLNGIGQMEGFTHQATLLYLDEGVKADAVAQTIFEELETYKDVTFGVSSLPVNGFVVRLLGRKSEQLFEMLKRIYQLIAEAAICLPSKTEAHV